MRTLETKRLILRNWKLSDTDDAFEFWSNPNVTISEGSLPMKSIDECKSLIEYLIKAKNNYAIELKSTGKVIGGIGLNEDAKGNENTRNLGYLLAEGYWNKGYMTESLSAVIENAKEITGALSAVCYNNPKSEHLLKKLGFECVDIIPNAQRVVDTYAYDEPYYILNL